ncbi:MAG: 30S ribosomal protein S4 [Candidatus Buchananbacteria bacterium]|nr:30S ribosomal protein S4 [Candidatus Buchananbacteria bacterium]
MRNNNHKACRRYGVKLCQSEKCPVFTRKYPPGIHGPKGMGRLTEYGTQLAEKQKAKVLYHINERQFRRYYEDAIRKTGDTGEFLIQALEARLDNAVYRSGLAKTRAQARQMVSHGFFLVNGKSVDVPSYQLKIKDTISIKPNKAAAKIFENLEKRLEKVNVVGWLHLDPKEKTIKVLSMPKPEEAEQAFNPRLVVELYSK